VQQLLQEDFGGGSEVKAFSGGVVVEGDKGVELVVGERSEVGLSGEEAAHPSDGVFDAALLPRRVGVAEEGLELDGMQAGVLSELGAVIEGDGLAQRLWQGIEEAEQEVCDEACGLMGGALADEDTGGAFVECEDGLAIGGEEHEVALPMSGHAAVLGLARPFGDGDAVLDEVCGASALLTAKAALGFGAGQIAAPGEVLMAGDLGVDEAVDGFVADDRSAVLQGQPASGLFRRQAVSEPVEDSGSEGWIAVKFGTFPAPCLGLVLGLCWGVAQ